jgi:hypothetical protein
MQSAGKFFARIDTLKAVEKSIEILKKHLT